MSGDAGPNDEPPALLDKNALDLISQGAEARVFATTLLGRRAIVKQRFKKKYRHPDLDARLTKQRLISEARSCARARKLGVRTPATYLIDQTSNCIWMERLPGRTVCSALQAGADEGADGLAGGEATRVMEEMGRAIAALHDGGMVHGDLTTSNVMLLDPAGGESEADTPRIALIDFGLAYNSQVPEDRAVDLYVLERAMTSAHGGGGRALFDAIIGAYQKASKHASATLHRYAEVRMRGRKRSMVG
ncbi:unnamed protein product [Pedinophyceae sp. YPF-701]|nr:unnamed protein product [Pedinophyceae sp. YPF-701]